MTLCKAGTLLACISLLSSQAYAEDPISIDSANSIDCKNLDRIQGDAAAGDSDAEFDLGRFYFAGHCVIQDMNEAGKWIGKSAGQGYTPAQVLGAVINYKGGFYSAAADLAERAANKGDAFGEYLIAFYYEHGKGVVQNNEKAAYWAKLSATQGNTGGQTVLAILLAEGTGVPSDLVEADKWALLASKRDSSGDTGNMVVYLESHMSKKDIDEAHKRADAWVPSKLQ